MIKPPKFFLVDPTDLGECHSSILSKCPLFSKRMKTALLFLATTSSNNHLNPWEVKLSLLLVTEQTLNSLLAHSFCSFLIFSIKCYIIIKQNFLSKFLSLSYNTFTLLVVRLTIVNKLSHPKLKPLYHAFSYYLNTLRKISARRGAVT
jgi:hypothetical protein